MALVFDVLYRGRPIALAYISPHPRAEAYNIVSVIPISRTGKWEDDTLEITFDTPLHDLVDVSRTQQNAIFEVLAQAAIEPDKIVIVARP
mgnify:CR=1 FL=1